MTDTELRNVSLAYAIEIAKTTGNTPDLLKNAEAYFQFLKGSTT